MPNVVRDEPGTPQVVDRSTFQAELESPQQCRSLSSLVPATTSQAPSVAVNNPVGRILWVPKRFHQPTR